MVVLGVMVVVCGLGEFWFTVGPVVVGGVVVIGWGVEADCERRALWAVRGFDGSVVCGVSVLWGSVGVYVSSGAGGFHGEVGAGVVACVWRAGEGVGRGVACGLGEVWGVAEVGVKGAVVIIKVWVVEFMGLVGWVSRGVVCSEARAR